MPEDDKGKQDNAPKSGEYKKVFPSGLWRILIAGALLLAALIVVGSYFVDEHSERIKFVTVNALSLLVAIVVAVQAYIYRRQWEAMEAQRDAMKEQGRLMNESLIHNERAAKAMEQAIEEARLSRELENRAYVALNSIHLEAPLLESFKAGELVVKFTMVNIGKTPARNVRGRMQHAFWTPNHDSDNELGSTGENYSETQSKSTLIPGRHAPATKPMTIRMTVKGLDKLREDLPAEITLPADKALRLPGIDKQLVEKLTNGITGEGRLYIFGEILYEDIFNNPCETRYCYFVHGLYSDIVDVCTNPDHNTFT